eukprot:239944_1
MSTTNQKRTLKQFEHANDDNEDSQPALFNNKVANFDGDKTLIAFNEFPMHWDQKIGDDNEITTWNSQHDGYYFLQKDIMFKKFHIGSMTKKMSYAERAFCFVDQNDNICIITDGYDKKIMYNIIDKYKQSDCNVNMYYNPNPNHTFYFNFGEYNLEVHRSYIPIIRIPYDNFRKHYDDSFEKHIIHHRIIYLNILKNNPQFKHEDNHIDVVKSMYAAFFGENGSFGRYRAYSEFAPENVTKNPTYEKLFMKCCFSERNKNLNAFISPFLILFQLYDKPWNKQKDIVNTLLCVLPSDISEESALIISEYLFTDAREFNFTDFIMKQLEIDAWDAHDLQKECGPNIAQYEWELYMRKRKFMANPYKYKYLNEYQQNKVNRALKRFLSKYKYTGPQVDAFLKEINKVPGE